MKLQHLAVGVALATANTFAGIIITDSYTATTLALQLNWSPESPNPEATSKTVADWKWDVTFAKAGGFVTATFNGQHTSPVGGVFSTILKVPTTGLGFAGDGDILVEPAGYDTWTASMIRNSRMLPLSLSIGAVHTPVPEPQTYAMLAGVGLVAFAGLRRFRR